MPSLFFPASFFLRRRDNRERHYFLARPLSFFFCFPVITNFLFNFTRHSKHQHCNHPSYPYILPSSDSFISSFSPNSHQSTASNADFLYSQSVSFTAIFFKFLNSDIFLLSSSHSCLNF